MKAFDTAFYTHNTTNAGASAQTMYLTEDALTTFRANSGPRYDPMAAYRKQPKHIDHYYFDPKTAGGSHYASCGKN
jgi:hypothetical protein